MKIAYVEIGKVYRVLEHGGQATRGDGAVGRGTKAIAREGGVRFRQGHAKPLPAVEFELLEAGSTWSGLPIGSRVPLPGRSVIAEWTPADDEYRERVTAARARRSSLLERLAELGMPGRSRGVSRTYSPGVTVTRTVVSFDRGAFEKWFRRIDPMEVAGSAIEAFVEELSRRNALRDDPEAALIDLARGAALDEMRQGLAVSDAELEVAPDAG